jgi:hypothetical protein
MGKIREAFTAEEWAALTPEEQTEVMAIDDIDEPGPIEDGEFGDLPYDVVLDPDGHPI